MDGGPPGSSGKNLGFPRQEYWSGLPFPSLGELPHQGLNLHILYCRQILYCTLQLKKKKILHKEQSSLKTNENCYKDSYTTKAVRQIHKKSHSRRSDQIRPCVPGSGLAGKGRLQGWRVFLKRKWFQPHIGCPSPGI